MHLCIDNPCHVLILRLHLAGVVVDFSSCVVAHCGRGDNRFVR